MINNLLLNPQYDSVATIPILHQTRLNLPFKHMLKLDVVKPHFVSDLLKNDDEAEVINKDKFQRKELVCAMYSNLVKITDVDFVKTIVNNYLIDDYDSKSGTDMLQVLSQMIFNCFVKRTGEEDEPMIDSSNLTNAIYAELIEVLLKNYEVSLIDSLDAQMESDTDQVTYYTDRHLHIEMFLVKFFRLYNQDRYTDDKNEGVAWLYEVCNKFESKLYRQICMSILFKVYFDGGFKLIQEKVSLLKELKEEKDNKIHTYLFWSIAGTLAQSKKGRDLLRNEDLVQMKYAGPAAERNIRKAFDIEMELLEINVLVKI